MKSVMKKQLLIGSVLLVASSQVWADAASSAEPPAATWSMKTRRFEPFICRPRGEMQDCTAMLVLAC